MLYRYSYIVKEGISTEVHYGLKLAELIGFPANVIIKASKVSKVVVLTKKSTKNELKN